MRRNIALGSRARSGCPKSTQNGHRELLHRSKQRCCAACCARPRLATNRPISPPCQRQSAALHKNINRINRV
jgi:hypothetical protein